jgi:hypothetical protein
MAMLESHLEKMDKQRRVAKIRKRYLKYYCEKK